MKTAICLIVLNYNIPSDGKIKRPPVDDISRGEIQVASKPLDLTSRQGIVPHMDISDHPYEWLSSIKPSTHRVLLLSQYYAWGSIQITFESNLPGAWIPIDPDLSQSGVGIPGAAARVPGVWLIW